MKLVTLSLACAVLLVGCDVDLGARPPVAERTFGEIVYREACQRVLYTEELAGVRAAGLSAGVTVDVSGVRYRVFCDGRDGAEVLGARVPPQEAPTAALALEAQRRVLVRAADGAVPEPLLRPLQTYLGALLPLQDDGTVRAVVSRGAAALARVASSDEAVAALYRLGWRDGYRPPVMAGALPRALLARPSLDSELGALLPLFVGGAAAGKGTVEATARTEWLHLLAAAQAELASTRALTRAEIASSDRTLRITTRFLLSTSAELQAAAAGRSMPAVLRDVRGLPVLAQSPIAAPYVDADADGLPDVDASGRFLGKDQAALPVVSPFPAPDPTAPGQKDLAAARDKDGRALVASGGAALYSYVNLDSTVLGALLRLSAQILAPERDLPLRLMSGLAHLLGPRRDARKSYEGGAALSYSGFTPAEGPVLDLAWGVFQILAYSDSGDAKGTDLQRLLGGVQALMRANESPVARALQATLQAFDEGKKPEYADAALPETATLFDDLAPLFVRMARVPGLIPDVIDALNDNRTADLGSMITRLATERGFFYMNQDDFDSAKAGAVTGTTGLAVNRALPDSDIDKNAANPQNNRSIMQRLLHLVHDANGLAFCNKKDSRVLLINFGACELYKIDDLALFYLLSIIGRDIRDNQGLYPAETRDPANFLNAIQSAAFRAAAGLGDNALGDAILEGSLGGTGIPGFTRYPTPQAAARLLFMTPDNPKRASLLKDTTDTGACSPQRPGTLCCNQNHSWGQHHDGVLFALERTYARDANGQDKAGVTLFSALAPVVSAFARHTECTTYGANGACNNPRTAAKILVDLLATLHRHWPTPQSRFFGMPYEKQSAPESISRYEPLAARLLAPDRDLFAASRDLTRAISATSAPDGTPLKVVLGNFVRWFFDPARPRLGGPLRYRDGATTALRGDGQPAFRRGGDAVLPDVLEAGASGGVTPYYILADAFRKKRERLAQDPAARERWSGAVSDLADLMFSAQAQAGQLRFKEPRSRPLTLATLDLVRDRVAAHARSGDLALWARGDAATAGSLMNATQDTLTGPLAAGLMDLSGRLAAADGARRALQTLLVATMDESGADPTPLAATASTAADALQLLLDDVDVVPLLNALAPTLDPEAGVADAAAALTRRGRDLDPQQVLLTVLKNLVQRDAGGSNALARVVDAVAEINRPQAGTAGLLGKPLSAADYRAVLGVVSGFLSDQERGLTRFLDIVSTRGGAP